MEELKRKKCKMPKCEKEARKQGVFFCGEHERKMKIVKDSAIAGVIGIAAIGIKVIFDKDVTE